MQELLTQIYGHLHSMWRYRWSGLLIAWGIAMAGWLGVYLLPDQYKANAVVFIDTDSIMRPLLEGLAVETSDRGEVDFITRMLLSRENLLSVVRETDMNLKVNSPADQERLVKNLSRSIVLKNAASSNKRAPVNIFEISYSANSPQQVYQVVSSLLNTLVEDTLGSGRTDTQLAQKFLDQQIREYEERLVTAEQALADFKKKNVGSMPDEKGGYYMRLQRQAQDIETTRSALLLAQRRYSELKRQLDGETPMLGSGAYSESAASKLRLYQEKLADLLVLYTDQHPDVQALKAKIEDLKHGTSSDYQGDVSPGGGDGAELNPVYQELKVEISKAQVDVETLKIQLQEHERKMEDLRQSVDAIPQVEAELAKLNRDYEVTKERYINLVDRRESARLAEDAEKSGSNITFRVIESPVIPMSPSGPNRALLLLAALVAGLGAGLGWTFLRSIFSPTFINFRQVRDTLGLPVLGAVSLYMSQEHKRRRRLQLAWFLTATFCLVVVFGGVLWQQDAGSVYLRSVLLQSSRQL